MAGKGYDRYWYSCGNNLCKTKLYRPKEAYVAGDSQEAILKARRNQFIDDTLTSMEKS